MGLALNEAAIATKERRPNPPRASKSHSTVASEATHQNCSPVAVSCINMWTLEGESNRG
jgi:hypothetical protein